MVGLVSLGGVVILDLMGWIGRANQWLSTAMGNMLQETFDQHLPVWSVWLVTVLLAFGMPLLLLAIDGGWRRATIWLVASGLMMLWVPVLALAAHRPEVMSPLLVTLGSGLLALLCAGRGRSGGDDTPEDSDEES